MKLQVMVKLFEVYLLGGFRLKAPWIFSDDLLFLLQYKHYEFVLNYSI
jgi:hypothetical protein